MTLWNWATFLTSYYHYPSMLVQEHRYNDETFLTGEGSLSYKNNSLKNPFWPYFKCTVHCWPVHPLFGEERHPITGEYDWTFPRLIICSNSMHSKQKLLRYGMDQRLIEQFYGSYEEYAGMNRSEWKEIVRKKLIHFACKSKSDFIRLSMVFVFRIRNI